MKAPIAVLALGALITFPAFAGPRENGNLYGAAERCNLPTQGLAYSNNRSFQDARQTAKNSRQDCRQVQDSLNYGYQGRQNNYQGRQNNYSNLSDQGNLYGATEACNLSTNGLAYSNSSEFQNARQNAQRSRQDCGQVQATRGQIGGGLADLLSSGLGINLGNRNADGNLFGAAEACGLSTRGLPSSNSATFQQARQNARQSRQDCGIVQQTIDGAGRY